MMWDNIIKGLNVVLVVAIVYVIVQCVHINTVNPVSQQYIHTKESAYDQDDKIAIPLSRAVEPAKEKRHTTGSAPSAIGLRLPRIVLDGMNMILYTGKVFSADDGEQKCEAENIGSMLNITSNGQVKAIHEAWKIWVNSGKVTPVEMYLGKVNIHEGTTNLTIGGDGKDCAVLTHWNKMIECFDPSGATLYIDHRPCSEGGRFVMCAKNL